MHGDWGVGPLTRVLAWNVSFVMDDVCTNITVRVLFVPQVTGANGAPIAVPLNLLCYVLYLNRLDYGDYTLSIVYRHMFMMLIGVHNARCPITVSPFVSTSFILGEHVGQPLLCMNASNVNLPWMPASS